MEFAYEGGGLAKGGAVTLYYDGNKVGEGQVPFTQPMIFSADETTDVGYESGSAVSSAVTSWAGCIGDSPGSRSPGVLSAPPSVPGESIAKSVDAAAPAAAS